MSWLDTLEQIRSKDFGRATAAERDTAARDVVNMSSYATAVVAISPLPFSDAVLMLPIQTAMVMTVGHIYGRKLEKAEAADLILELGAIAGVSFLARQGLKALLPVVGALLTVPAAFAANWAMGRVAMEYFKNPGLSKDALRSVYEQAKQEGSAAFSRSSFEEFRRSEDKAKVEPIPEPVAAPAPKRSAKPAAKGPAKKSIGRASGSRAAPARKQAVPARKSIGRKAPKPQPADEAPTEAAPAAGPMTPRRIIEQEIPARVRAHRDVAERINAVVHLVISGDSGGEWTVDLTRPERCVSQGLTGTPKMTVSAAAEDFVEIATGKADAQMAVLTGKLKLEPLDLELAGDVGKLFT